jgi:hypothetical protein
MGNQRNMAPVADDPAVFGSEAGAPTRARSVAVSAPRSDLAKPVTRPARRWWGLSGEQEKVKEGGAGTMIFSWEGPRQPQQERFQCAAAGAEVNRTANTFQRCS